MFKCSHTRGQDFGDDCICNHRETIVDGTCGSRILEVIHFSQRQYEGEHARTIIEQDLTRLPHFQTSEGEGRPGGESEGVNGADRIGAKGNGIGIVSQLNALFHQLVDNAPSIDITREEAQDVAPLELTDDLHRHFIGFSSPNDGSETGHPPIHQLDTPCSQADIIYRTIEMAGTVLVSILGRSGQG